MGFSIFLVFPQNNEEGVISVLSMEQLFPYGEVWDIYYLVPKYKQKLSALFPPLFSENKNSEQTWLLTAVKYMRSYLQRNNQPT